jgi:SAM-dependent methyltransferase
MSYFTKTLTGLRQSGMKVLVHKALWKVRYPGIYAPMLLAFDYCKGQGIELGAAAYNPFNLKACLNVAPYSDNPNDPSYKDFELYRDWQIQKCGRYAPVDLAGDANHIPVPDHSQDYILSSHVVEHLPNLIGAFLSWNRVLKPGGVIFMIFPKRDALENDSKRPVTQLEHFIEDFQSNQSIATHPIPEGDRIGGHYHVFTLASMLELIQWCNANVNLAWRVEATEETDSKVGNGHTVVCRYLPADSRLD